MEKRKKSLRGAISDEIMFNYGSDNRKNIFDQNRMYIALCYYFDANIGLELGYLKSYQRRSSGINFYDLDIIRFTVYRRIN